MTRSGRVANRMDQGNVLERPQAVTTTAALTDGDIVNFWVHF